MAIFANGLAGLVLFLRRRPKMLFAAPKAAPGAPAVYAVFDRNTVVALHSTEREAMVHAGAGNERTGTDRWDTLAVELRK
jgi:hypothetical protein